MPKATIAIPTYNRSSFLKKSIAQTLKQKYKDFELLIVDNCSTDDTQKVVESFSDAKIRYHKNQTNIGMMNNWNRCVELAKGELLLILGDDDLLNPDFLQKSVKVHEKHPDLGFSFSHCNKIDINDKVICRWGYDYTPVGYLKLYDYSLYTVKYGCCLPNSSTTLINMQVFDKVGLFEGPYAANSFDFNMWNKIAMKYPTYFIKDNLCGYRIHKQQVSEIHWRKKNTGKIATYLEIIAQISMLMNVRKVLENDSSREMLTAKLIEYNQKLSQLIKKIAPEL